MIRLWEHPLSPYAQKNKIALLEKGVSFESVPPEGLGSGTGPEGFLAANPRGEVPVLVDGDTTLFDSTVILEYIEDRWPAPPLLPTDPAERARVRTLEDVLDTHYEAITWGLGEIFAFGRATGELAERMVARAGEQLAAHHAWLEPQLAGADWLNGASFGWGDVCAAPFLNGAARFGLGPAAGSRLAAWLERVNERPSVAAAREAALAAADSGEVGLDVVRELIEKGAFQREYRDHRLEWMIKTGGLQIVEDGLAKRNIRFVEFQA